MNSAVVKNAVGTLDKLLSEARRALRQIEADVFQYGFEGGGYPTGKGNVAILPSMAPNSRRVR